MSLPSEIQSMEEDRHEENIITRAIDIYRDYQALMAGQSIETEEQNKKRFLDLCLETEQDAQELWQECENLGEMK